MLDYRDASHDHTFGVDKARPGERRTAIVVGITAVMMVAEITAGIAYGSMALLADGLHMASHAVALTVTLFAYVLARRWALDPRYSFGTGKLNALGAFASAVLLAGFAGIMAIESIKRFLDPVAIQFDQALWVAVIGLAVNGVSAMLLMHDHSHDDHGHGHAHSDHDHDDDHDHDHDDHHDHSHDDHDHDHAHAHHDHEHAHSHRPSDHQHHDHNLRAAYLHVVADALTSILAIFALLAGKYFGANWLDPAMGIVGAILVGRWSVGLLKQTSAVLLDRQADDHTLAKIKHQIEAQTGGEVVDLHVWEVAPGARSAAITVLGPQGISARDCRAAFPSSARISHSTIEVISEKLVG